MLCAANKWLHETHLHHPKIKYIMHKENEENVCIAYYHFKAKNVIDL